MKRLGRFFRIWTSLTILVCLAALGSWFSLSFITWDWTFSLDFWEFFARVALVIGFVPAVVGEGGLYDPD